MAAETPVSVITTAVDGIQDNVLPIAGVALGIGGLVLALTKGWGLVKKFF